LEELVTMYDLLLKGGTVLDPSQSIHERLDVAITGGRISRLAPGISSEEASRIIDVEGKIVAPGLIDIHAHVYAPAGPERNRNHPDNAGVLGGVTTVADAGSPGPGNFRDFCDVVLPRAQTSVYSFLSIFQDRSRPMMSDESQIDIAGVVETAKGNPELVKGVKVLIYPGTVQSMGLKHLEAAKAAARESGIRVLMHIGDIGPKSQTPTPPEVTARALSMLDPGDIVTHVFSPLTGAALDSEGRVLSELKEAQERGVIMDPSYGDFNFGWERAESVMAQGLVPDTIGTDIEVQAGVGMREVSTRGLLEYTAYFLDLGFSLEDVIRMTTITPARALGIEDRAGSLAVGHEADVSVLDLLEGQWQLTDAAGVSRTGSKALAPVVTIKGGLVVEPGEGPHPWGWAPPTAVDAGVQAGGR
jgi:dihydroorotase